MAHNPHKLAIVVILHSDNRARQKGFRKNVRDTFLEWYGRDQTEACLWHVTDAPVYIPDAYFVDEDERLIRVYEVEDTHKLEAAKLEYYMSFATAIDEETTDWEFELIVTDRYGTLDRQIPLMELIGGQVELDHPKLKDLVREINPRRKCYRCEKTFNPEEHTLHLKQCVWPDA